MVNNRIHNKFLEIHRTLVKVYDKQEATVSKTKFSVKNTKSEDEGVEIVLPSFKQLQLFNGKVELGFEALPFLFSINGHDKDLLLFIISYCLDENSLFPWNRIVAAHYADYYEAIKEERPAYDTIRQSIVALKKKNIIRKVESRKFMLNPLLFSTTSYNRDKLIRKFGEISSTQNVIEALFLPLGIDRQ